jgi:hypothetical protein
MSFGDQKGNVIAYVVIAMTTIAALAVGALYMTSTSSLGEIGTNNLNKAYFLALAGKDYALIKNLEDTLIKYPGGRIFTFANGDKFQLVISGNNITSTGIVNEGTPFEARKTISITKTGFSSRPDVSFPKDIQAFAPVQSQAGFITTDTSAARVNLGNSKTGSFGTVWYSGSDTEGNCQNGKCDFGAGFRAFFVFQFAAGSTGDGFTFAFFNGDGVDVNGVKNGINSVGGDSGRGELLGYAGDSRIDSAGTIFLDGKGGRGIQPPKVAVEFDSYSNCCDSPPCGSCKNNVCSTNSRYDGDYNHMAYVFWGDNTTFCGTTVGKNTYDDNKHGAGTGGATDPQNARSYRNTGGIDSTSYFNGTLYGWASSWLLTNAPTNIYAIRIEVTRSTTQNIVTGNYDYTINSWMKQCSVSDISCPTYDDLSDFANTKIDYNNLAPADTPTLNRAFALSPTFHQNFGSFYFGWTAATGGATQNVTLNRFRMNFRK